MWYYPPIAQRLILLFTKRNAINHLATLCFPISVLPTSEAKVMSLSRSAFRILPNGSVVPWLCHFIGCIWYIESYFALPCALATAFEILCLSSESYASWCILYSWTTFQPRYEKSANLINFWHCDIGFILSMQAATSCSLFSTFVLFLNFCSLPCLLNL